VNSSWGFRFLIWPFWSTAGVWGVFAWRWLSTLAAFALLWLAARRMGARGLTALAVLTLMALTWRYRAQVRPETLVGVLLALQIWILETRRAAGPDRSPWLIPIAWAWANVHLSFPLGLAMVAVHVVNDMLASLRIVRAEHRPRPGPLPLVLLGAIAISFVNPFGWRAVWQPIEFLLAGRDEPIYRAIGELQPLFPDAWRSKLGTGLPFVLVAWPILMAWRWWRRGLDAVELAAAGLFTFLALSATRFAGFYALVAAPYLARDLGEWLATVARPSWLRPAAVRAGAASAACVLISLPEWTRPDMPIAVAYDERKVPARACDFMRDEGVGGRGFNPFTMGGYMLWRFWPERDRLPFMDIHQSGTRGDRDRYVAAYARPDGWSVIDAHYAFDYALLDAVHEPGSGDRLRDALDTDTRFALVFRDDVAALYVRRAGRHAALAQRSGYALVPGGEAALDALGRACAADSSIRARARLELERMVASSEWNARGHSLLANLDLLDGALDAAHAHLEKALERDPATQGAHERLGLIAARQGRWPDAVRELEAEVRAGGGSPLLPRRLARAYQALGDVRGARKWYGEAMRLAPDDVGLRDSLRVLEGR
jgi:hypothetical protein